MLPKFYQGHLSSDQLTDSTDAKSNENSTRNVNEEGKLDAVEKCVSDNILQQERKTVSKDVLQKKSMKLVWMIKDININQSLGYCWVSKMFTEIYFTLMWTVTTDILATNGWPAWSTMVDQQQKQIFLNCWLSSWWDFLKRKDATLVEVKTLED